MIRNVENGKVKNIKETTKTRTDEDGKKVTEHVKIDKDTGKVLDHTVDGKPVEQEEVRQEKKPAIVQYHAGNGDFIQVKLLEMVVNQLKEMNYYLRLQVEGPIDDEEVKKIV